MWFLISLKNKYLMRIKIKRIEKKIRRSLKRKIEVEAVVEVEVMRDLK
jgi:hypothetical protein